MKMSKLHEKVDELRGMLEEIELNTMQYSLADAIREGTLNTEQAVGTFGTGDTMCAMSSAVQAAKARGFM
jgi:phosphate starvation-inducible protein PhoH